MENNKQTDELFEKVKQVLTQKGYNFTDGNFQEDELKAIQDIVDVTAQIFSWDVYNGSLAISALEKIANTIAFLKAEAERDGNKFNGAVAYSIANDHVYLKSIARETLAEISEKNNLKAEIYGKQ